MSETRIFCSVLIFILGIYTIVLLQYELFKLNSLSSSNAPGVSISGGEKGVKSKVSANADSNGSDGGNGNNEDRKRGLQPCNSTMKKTKFRLDRLNCGSAGDLLDLAVQNCAEQLPCDIQHNINYSVVLHFSPSRDISTLEIQTSVRQKKDLKYLHKETMHVDAKEGEKTTLKFSFLLPPYPIFKPKKKVRKCIPPGFYQLGVEIWDVPSGIGELCLRIPMLVYF